MARATVPTSGEKADPTKWPAEINADYISRTVTTDQDIASDLVFASGKKPVYDGSPGAVYNFVKSGRSPITFAHGIGEAPTGVVATVKAVQPYIVSCNWDATNIIIYHNAAASLTVSVHAWVT